MWSLCVMVCFFSIYLCFLECVSHVLVTVCAIPTVLEASWSLSRVLINEYINNFVIIQSAKRSSETSQYNLGKSGKYLIKLLSVAVRCCRRHLHAPLQNFINLWFNHGVLPYISEAANVGLYWAIFYLFGGVFFHLATAKTIWTCVVALTTQLDSASVWSLKFVNNINHCGEIAVYVVVQFSGVSV